MAMESAELPKFQELVSQRLLELEEFLVIEHTKRVKLANENELSIPTQIHLEKSLSRQLSPIDQVRSCSSASDDQLARNTSSGDVLERPSDDQLARNTSRGDVLDRPSEGLKEMGKLNVHSRQKLGIETGFAGERKASTASIFSIQSDAQPHKASQRSHFSAMSHQSSSNSIQSSASSARFAFPTSVIHAKMRLPRLSIKSDSPAPRFLASRAGTGDSALDSAPTTPTAGSTVRFLASRAATGDGISEVNPKSFCDEEWFEVLPAWVAKRETRKSHAAGAASRITEISVMSRISSGETDYEEHVQKPCHFWETVVIHPESKKRYLWESFGLLFVMWDLVTIPLRFLDLPQTQASQNVAWAGRLFWTVDLVLHFFLGYSKPDGCPELQWGNVVRHYLTRTFAVDICVLSTEWIEMSRTQALSDLQVLQAFRLLRLARTRIVMDLVVDYFESERWLFVISISRNIAVIVSMTHVIACLWVGVGKIESGWISQNLLEGNDVIYLAGFHWALTQLTGNMEVIPTNIWERLFAICCLLMGFIFATAFVSSITSSMTRLMITENQQASQLRCLSKFLHEQGVSRKLTHRVQLNARHMLEEQHRHTAEVDVELLHLVSETLLVELHFEIHAPRISPHPLFRYILRQTPALMRQICHSCMDCVLLLEKDLLFSPGEAPIQPQMIFICAGALAYTQDRNTYMSVTVDEWICEQVLWLEWIYRGELRASSNCRLAILNAETFTETVKKSSIWSGLDLNNYASNYVKQLNEDEAARSELGSALNYSELMTLTFPYFDADGSQEASSWWHISRNSGSKLRNSGESHHSSSQVSKQSSVVPQ